MTADFWRDVATGVAVLISAFSLYRTYAVDARDRKEAAAKQSKRLQRRLSGWQEKVAQSRKGWVAHLNQIGMRHSGKRVRLDRLHDEWSDRFRRIEEDLETVEAGLLSAGRSSISAKHLALDDISGRLDDLLADMAESSAVREEGRKAAIQAILSNKR